MKNYLFLICLIGVVVFFAFGVSFEAYESLLSSFVQGVYTKPDIYDWNLDWHFLLFPLYAKLNNYFPTIQLYGLILLFYNCICIAVAGLLLSKFIDLIIDDNRNKIILFVGLFSIVLIDNFINLNSTRIVFLSIFTLFGWLEYYRITKHPISFKMRVIMVLLILYLTLIRMDAVFLSSLIYIVYLVLHKRFHWFSLLPLIISASFLFSYVFYIIPNADEARQAFYYNELDVIDRDNVDYTKLTALQSLEVDALRTHLVFDKEHFTTDFYNTISDSCKDVTRLVNGFNINDVITTLKTSIIHYLSYWYFIFFAAFPVFFLIHKIREKRWLWLIHLFISVFLPVFVCMYVITPPRFLVPYYITIGCLNVLLYLRYIGFNKKILFFIFFILFFEIIIAFLIKRTNVQQEANFRKTIHNIHSLALNKNSKGPIIVHQLDLEKFFPVNPLLKVDRQNLQFLNFYYFNSYDCYVNNWKDICQCNGLSLKEKLDYIVQNDNLFIINQKEFEFLEKYISEKYHQKLVQKETSKLDEFLIVCKIKYE